MHHWKLLSTMSSTIHKTTIHQMIIMCMLIVICMLSITATDKVASYKVTRNTHVHTSLRTMVSHTTATHQQNPFSLTQSRIKITNSNRITTVINTLWNNHIYIVHRSRIYCQNDTRTTYIRNETDAVQMSRQTWIMECNQMREDTQILYKHHDHTDNEPTTNHWLYIIWTEQWKHEQKNRKTCTNL